MIKKIVLLAFVGVLLFVSLTTVSFALYTEIQKTATVNINGVKVSEIAEQTKSLFSIKNVSSKDTFSNNVTINSGVSLTPVVPTDTDLQKWYDGNSSTTNTDNVLIKCFQIQNNTSSAVSLSLSSVTISPTSSSSADTNAKNCGRIAMYLSGEEYDKETLIYNTEYKYGTSTFSTKSAYTKSTKSTLNPDEDLFLTVYIWVDYATVDSSASLGSFSVSFTLLGE